MPKPVSQVYDHFSATPADVAPGQSYKRDCKACKHCSSHVSTNRAATTSNLLTHLKLSVRCPLFNSIVVTSRLNGEEAMQRCIDPAMLCNHSDKL